MYTVHRMFSAANWQPLFLNELCRQIINGVLRPSPAGIKFHVSASEVRVDSDQVHHLSMVINELATNSLKYSLNEPARSLIDIDITEEAGKVCLTFRDNGPGYPENIICSEYEGTSLGFDHMRDREKKPARDHIIQE